MISVSSKDPEKGALGKGKKALLFLGHGSRAADANDGMYRTMGLVKEMTGYEIVEAGFMDLNAPSIPEGAAACVAQGATMVLMIPYFLHLGRHVQRDLPNTVRELKQRYPGVEIVLGRHIGFHPKLAEIIVERVHEMDGDGGEP